MGKNLVMTTNDRLAFDDDDDDDDDVGMAEQRAITLDFLSKFVSKMAREKNLRMVVHYGLIH